MTASQLFSRRDMIRMTATAGAGLTLGANAQNQGSETLFAYVSSWTSGANGAGGDGGIHVFEVDRTDGSLKLLSSTAPELNAGYFCISQDGRYLYSTDERRDYGGKSGAGGGVAAFTLDPTTHLLSRLNVEPSLGAFPAYIAVSPTGSEVLVANHGGYDPVTRVVRDPSGPRIENVYDDAAVALFRAANDGRLSPARDVAILDRTHTKDPKNDLPDTGMALRFRASPHAHSVNFVPGSPFAIACDKGMDRIYVFRVSDGALERVFVYNAPPKSAPRHSAFHPTRPYVFIINELEPSLSSLSIDLATGRLEPISTVSTLSGDFVKSSRPSPSDVNVHPNGNFVYGATRGSNSIAIIRVDEKTGKLTTLDCVSSGGNGPRGFRIDPSGTFLFSSNLTSGDIVTFRINSETGALTPTGAKISVPRPTCLRFLQSPRR